MREPHRDLLVGLGLALLLVAPAAARGELAGSPGAEVYGHAWVQGWASAGWPAWPRGTDLALGTESWPVIDPLPTWLAAGLARLMGLTAAWNALYAAAIVGAAAGGGALARAFGGSGLYGAVGLALSPIWLGSLTSGLTEDAAVGLAAWALAELHAGRRWLGGLLLGVLAWCGLYLAWLAGAVALFLGAWHLARRSGPVTDWLLAAVLAGVVGLGAARPFAERLAGEGHRSGAPPVGEEPLWRLNPWRKVDVASFFVPGEVDPGEALVREHPAYAGWTTLGLAVVGGGPWTLLAALPAAVAVGDPPAWLGHPLDAPNPVVTAFRALPLADRFNHLGRVWIVGEALLVVLAARGVRRLPRRAEPWLVALVAVEVAALSPARVPLPGTPTAAPPIYAALASLPPGPVVVLGAAGPGVHPQKLFFDQRAHGRRLLANPNRPVPPRDLPAGALVVTLDAAATAEAERALGPPDVRAGDGAAWGP